MKYLYTFYLYLIFTSACLAQKIECHVSLGSNISFSSFNDNIYSYAPIPPDIGFYSYRQLPPNVYRKTIPKLGLQVQGDVFYKLQPKVYIGTGLKLLLYRHAYDQEFEENPFDPFGNKWSSEPGYSPPTIIAILSDKIKEEVQEANANYELAIQQKEVYLKAQEQATENYRIVKDKYDNGLSTTNDLLEADVDQIQAKINYAIATSDIQEKYYELLYQQGKLTQSFNVN